MPPGGVPVGRSQIFPLTETDKGLLLGLYSSTYQGFP
jgi:hypothetical protein